MEYTGERFIPNNDGVEIEAEHVHRYKCISNFVHNMWVLDAGCGTGYGSLMLAQSAEKVTGIDISDEAIEWCQNHYGTQHNLNYIQSSLAGLPFPNDTFDCIVCFEVIEHVDKETQIVFLKEAKRVLKQNGVLIVSTPNKAIYTDSSGYHNPFHISEFYPDEFREYLNKEFVAVNVYDQTLYMVSAITGGRNGEGANLIKNSNIDSSEKYMIAVCGNNRETVESIDLNSVYKFDTPAGVNISTLYVGLPEGMYSQHYKKNAVLTTESDNQFSITFDISQNNKANRFRFDPIENYFCLCGINEVNTDGQFESVLPLNAFEYYKVGFVFLNIDPQFEIVGEFSDASFITISGYFKRLTQVEISEFLDEIYTKMMKELADKDALLIQALNKINPSSKLMKKKNDELEMELVPYIDDLKMAITTNNEILLKQFDAINQLQNIIINQNEVLLETRNRLSRRKRFYFF